MVLSAPTRQARGAAVATALLGLAYATKWREIAGTADYLGLVVGVVVVLSAVAAPRLWFGGHLDGRVVATSVAVIALAGQLLNRTVGLPGAESLADQMGLASLIGIVLELAILALLARDCREASGSSDVDLYPVTHVNHGSGRRGR